MSLNASGVGRNSYSFNRLSSEVIVLVLKELGYREIVRARLVCRFWLQIINDSLLLRYLVILGCHGKTEHWVGSQLTTDERLKNFIAHKSRWRFLPHELRYPIKIESHSLYHLSQSILADGDSLALTKLLFLRVSSGQPHSIPYVRYKQLVPVTFCVCL